MAEDFRFITVKQNSSRHLIFSSAQIFKTSIIITNLNYSILLFSFFQGDLVTIGILSGNRNFEGRIHPLTRANYLASPLLVIAYALAGTVNIDFETEPLGECNNIWCAWRWTNLFLLFIILNQHSQLKLHLTINAIRLQI